MKKLFVLLFSIVLMFSLIGMAQATPDKAKNADKTCGDCHSKISHNNFGN